MTIKRTGYYLFYAQCRVHNSSAASGRFKVMLGPTTASNWASSELASSATGLYLNAPFSPLRQLTSADNVMLTVWQNINTGGQDVSSGALRIVEVLK